jgi:L-asparaginase II
MLATCFQLGYPIDSYLSPEHPLQLQILDLVAEAMGRESASIALATDGCSVPTFGGTVTEFARSFAALANPAIAPSDRIRAHEPAIARILAAMSAYPENIAGAGSLDTELMRLSNGEIVAKMGAEGLLCMALPKRGLGVAIRVSDGTYRGLDILAITVLEQLGLVESSMLTSMKTLLDQPVTNANGWTVGAFRTDLAI